MRCAWLLLVLAACPPAPSTPDASVPVGACLDRPEELTRAPNGQLPCELLPPGFQR
jgi:hypothetical protein